MDPHSLSLLEKPHPYDEQTYLAALHKRNSSLTTWLPSATSLGWKSAAVPKIFSGSLLTDQLRCLSGRLSPAQQP